MVFLSWLFFQKQHNQLNLFFYRPHKKKVGIIYPKNLPANHGLNAHHVINRNLKFYPQDLIPQALLQHWLAHQSEVEHWPMRHQIILLHDQSLIVLLDRQFRNRHNSVCRVSLRRIYWLSKNLALPLLVCSRNFRKQ